MKPAEFGYLRPADTAAAVAALAAHPDAAVLAGGQSLMAMLNMRLAAPSHLIDISRLDELRGASLSGDRLRLGALTRHADLIASAAVAEAAPMLVKAARALAHPAIRNRGTLGGSLALADPAAELPACVLALDATVEATGPDGTRRIAAADFFHGPFETALQPGELLTAIEIPRPAADTVWSYDKLARRNGDYALAGLTLTGRSAGDRLTGLAIAVFGVADRPGLCPGAARAIEAGDVDAAVAALARDLAPMDQPGCSGATKLHLAGVLLRRAVASLQGDAS